MNQESKLTVFLTYLSAVASIVTSIFICIEVVMRVMSTIGSLKIRKKRKIGFTR